MGSPDTADLAINTGGIAPQGDINFRNESPAVYQTNEPQEESPFPHPRIETFRLPEAFSGPVAAYLTKYQLEDLSTAEKVSVALTLDKCAKLALVPSMLERLGLDEVTIEVGPELTSTCEGFAAEQISDVVFALLASARVGDIPAQIALIALLDPGGAGLRVQMENQEHSLQLSTDEVYREVHRLAYESIASGNLFSARQVSLYLVMHGTVGLYGSHNQGALHREPHRPSLVRAAANEVALWSVGADRVLSSSGRGLVKQLTVEEKEMMQQQADTLVQQWLALPVLYESDIKAQGFWEPGLY